MSYRDDVDALYERAATLQRDLERAQAELAHRDAELAAMRGDPQIFASARPPLPTPSGPPPSGPPPPGEATLRELPAAETALAQLIETLTPRAPAADEPSWLEPYRAKLVEAARGRLDALDPESLVLVGAIIEELAMEPAHRADVLERLRPIVRHIARR